MPDRDLRFPGGYETSPERISRVRVHARRSVFPTRVFIEVFEGDAPVYTGYVNLAKSLRA